MSNNSNRIQLIEQHLNAALAPEWLEVIDESHLHIGHAGARDGRGHFKVRIASSLFHGLTRMAQHRMVYRALGPLMQSDIHAINIEAFSSNEI